MKLKIKDLELDSNIILAPMAGFSDTSFRQIIRSFSKKSLVCTEMISSEALMWNKSQDICQSEKIEKPISYQLSGHKPDLMAKGALKLEGQADIIDINMGCPVAKIVKNQDGSALMKNPNLAFDIVKEVKSVIKKPLSIKMRLGFDNNSKNYLEFVQKMEEAGADMIVVHGRTRSQMYSGEVDYEAIKKIKKTVTIPIIANGDITTLEKAIEVLKTTKADGLMIGRGAIGQPELIHRIEYFLDKGEILPELSLKERIDVLIRHLNLELTYYREPINALKFMRKFYAYYIRDIRGASQYREKLVKAESFDEIFSVLDEIKNI